MPRTTRTAQPATLQIHDDTVIGRSLRLVVLVRSWPSLGITGARPLYGLRSPNGRVMAQGTDRARLLDWAGTNGHRVALADLRA